MENKIVEYLEVKLDNLIDRMEDKYICYLVGTNTQGIAHNEYYTDTWEDMFNELWNDEKLNKDSIELDELITEEDYMDAIRDNIDFYYYLYTNI